jgi:hypothetical protein
VIQIKSDFINNLVIASHKNICLIGFILSRSRIRSVDYNRSLNYLEIFLGKLHRESIYTNPVDTYVKFSDFFFIC